MLPRDQFAKHPWSLSGGGADDLETCLSRLPNRLSKVLDSKIGFASGYLGRRCLYTACRSASDR